MILRNKRIKNHKISTFVNNMTISEKTQNHPILKNKITLNEIYKTLYADLIGKDSHRGITLTYGWMANQVGHFSLGFIPTYITFLIIENPVRSFLIVALFWLCFEFINALSPLYKKEYNGNGVFKVQWGNLIFDTLTDLSFFWFGGLTSLLLETLDATVFYVLLIMTLALFFAGRYWFVVKLYQQNAFFPFQFRLSQWNSPIHSENVQPLIELLTKQDRNKHFLVIGKKGRGKTSLMVGLANEFAILKNKSTYTTFSKWLSLLNENTSVNKQISLSLWNWTESDFLIIDDINPGEPIDANKYTAADILLYIESKESERNKIVLQNMNVAWIIGDFHQADNAQLFSNVLIKLGINAKNIFVIDLNRTSE